MLLRPSAHLINTSLWLFFEKLIYWIHPVFLESRHWRERVLKCVCRETYDRGGRVSTSSYSPDPTSALFLRLFTGRNAVSLPPSFSVWCENVAILARTSLLIERGVCSDKVERERWGQQKGRQTTRGVGGCRVCMCVCVCVGSRGGRNDTDTLFLTRGVKQMRFAGGVGNVRFERGDGVSLTPNQRMSPVDVKIN